MNSEKYIGLDVHQATISVAVMDSRGKVVMESILETKASTILEFFTGLRGTLSVTFELPILSLVRGNSWKSRFHETVCPEPTLDRIRACTLVSDLQNLPLTVSYIET